MCDDSTYIVDEDDVLIPLNRVICIELNKVGLSGSLEYSLNPLKSGHMY